jgi:hypothetical protein
MDNTNRTQFVEHAEKTACTKAASKESNGKGYDWFAEESDRDLKLKGRQIGEAILEKLSQ